MKPAGGPATAAPAGDLLGRCDFPPSGTAVSLAVSGGADSLALLVLAARAGLDATVVHVDHGIRSGSAGEAAAVAGVAGRYGLAFRALSVDIAPGADLEARARAARYSVLPAGAMTGHTMDDQAETILLNLLRGAGIDGLSGMARVPVDRSATGGSSGRVWASAPRLGVDTRAFVPPPTPKDGDHAQTAPWAPPRRPLLGLRRHETAELCAAEGLEPFADPSNEDPRFRRNRVRAELVPLLCDIAGRDVVPVLARQAALMAEEAALLDGLAGALDPTDARSLGAAPAPLARRALRRWLRDPASGGDHEAHPPSAAELARVLAVVAGDATACELAGGRRVARSRGRLRVGSR